MGKQQKRRIQNNDSGVEIFEAEFRELFDYVSKLNIKEAKNILTRLKRLGGNFEKSFQMFQKDFENIFVKSSFPVAVYEPIDNGKDFVFVGFNKAAERTEKIKVKDVLGKRVTKVFPGVEEFGLLDVFRRVWQTGKHETHPVKAYKDNRILGYRENDVFKLPSGKIVALYKDLTKEKQNEEKIRVSEEKYRTLFNSVGEMILVHPFSENGYEKFINVNVTACKKLGYTKDELLNLSVSDISEKKDAERFGSVEYRNRMKNKKKIIALTNFITKKGKKIPVEIISTFLDSKEEKIIISVARDRTEREKWKMK